jgi:hypothetical protein
VSGAEYFCWKSRVQLDGQTRRVIDVRRDGLFAGRFTRRTLSRLLRSCQNTRFDRGISMLNGVLVGFGIMLASLVIPIVHYVAVPLSPFIAGFIGGGVAKIDQDGIVKFGGLMAGLMLVPSIVILLIKFAFGVDEIIGIPTMLWVWVTAALIPYTWFGATVGALGGYYIRRNKEESQ